MSAYIEVMVAGNCRALIEAAHIKGVLASPGARSDDLSTVESPMTLLMASGETLPGVYGISPDRLILYIAGVRALLRRTGRAVAVVYLDKAEEFEAELAHLIVGGRESGDSE